MLGVNKYLDIVNNELKKLFSEREEESEDVHRDYYKKLEEFVMRGGKRLRPIGLIMAYIGVGGLNVEDIAGACAAIELLHNSSLIQDDVMDRDELRRGKPTFHVIYREWFKRNFGSESAERFGDSMGILGGDSLLEMGVKSLLKVKAPLEKIVKIVDIYLDSYRGIIEGQLLDLLFERKIDITEEDYLKMIDLKTGALFKGALLIGGVLGGGDEEQLKALGEYAVLMARAFQIQDDILGTFGKEEETGKPTDSDIKQGKKTLLVIKSLERDSPEQRKTLLSILGREDAKPEEVEAVRRIFVSTGALDYAKARAREFAEKAKNTVHAKARLKREAANFFISLADFVINRKY